MQLPRSVLERAGTVIADSLSAVSRRFGASEESAAIAAKAEHTFSNEIAALSSKPAAEAFHSPKAVFNEPGDSGTATLRMDILSGKQLMERVRTEPENYDLLGDVNINDNNRLRYLTAGEISRETHFTLSSGNRIIGIAGVQTDPSASNVLWVKHVSVEQPYWGKGYARNLVESIYPWAVEHGQQVSPSSFTELGQKLKPIFDRLDQKYPQAAHPYMRTGESTAEWQSRMNKIFRPKG